MEPDASIENHAVNEYTDLAIVTRKSVKKRKKNEGGRSVIISLKALGA